MVDCSDNKEARIFTEYRLHLLQGQLPDASSHFSEGRVDLLDDINSSGQRQLSRLEGSDCLPLLIEVCFKVLKLGRKGRFLERSLGLTDGLGIRGVELHGHILHTLYKCRIVFDLLRVWLSDN